MDLSKLQSIIQDYKQLSETAKKFTFLLREEGLTEDQVNYLDMVEHDIEELSNKMQEYHNYVIENCSAEILFPLDDEISKTKYKILVADSDSVQLMKTKDALEKAGHYVITASSGTSAFGLYRDNDLDLILLDCDLNELDGFLLTKAIRKLEGQNKSTPIIAYTAFGGAGYQQRCLEIGMNDYIKKPILMNELVEKISTHFKN